MKNPEQIRLQNKLKLWDTPGFFQFIEDLEGHAKGCREGVKALKLLYTSRLNYITNKDKKFKQGDLGL